MNHKILEQIRGGGNPYAQILWKISIFFGNVFGNSNAEMDTHFQILYGNVLEFLP